MCLIHIRPARDPSPDPMVVPSRPITRGTLPAPPLSPHAYHSPRASRPHSIARHSQSQIPRSPHSPRVSGPVGEPLKRLSIHSREQFEAQQLKQLERERERDSSAQSQPTFQRSEQPQPQPQAQQPQAQTHSNLPPPPPPPPTAPSPPSPPHHRSSYERSRPPPPTTSHSPHTSASGLPPLRRGSDYTYGSAPIPALSNGSLISTTPRASQAALPPTSPAARDKENIPLAQMPPPTTSKAGHHHRRRESGVSVVNGKDGSLVERERPSLGAGHRSSSLSVGAPRRGSMGPGRRSAGNVSLVATGDGGGGSGSGAGDPWGGNPRSSQRSVRERVVIVEEGRRRREYVRWEG